MFPKIIYFEIHSLWIKISDTYFFKKLNHKTLIWAGFPRLFGVCLSVYCGHDPGHDRSQEASAVSLRLWHSQVCCGGTTDVSAWFNTCYELNRSLIFESFNLLWCLLCLLFAVVISELLMIEVHWLCEHLLISDSGRDGLVFFEHAWLAVETMVFTALLCSWVRDDLPKGHLWWFWLIGVEFSSKCKQHKVGLVLKCTCYYNP